jgi:hypothetical protein
MPEGVGGSQVPALFPWRVCELFTDARGGSFDRMAVRCQLLFLWRVRKGICGCQRGGLFAIVRQLGASSCSSGGS